MIIRNMRRSDYEQVDKLLMQLHRMDMTARPDLFSPLERYMTKESFASLVENRRTITILAQERREVLGCCFVSVLERGTTTTVKTAYIDLIVVDEKHRRKGIGRRLFQEVQRRANRVGAIRIDLTVWSHNPIAVRAYEAYGMVPQRHVYEMALPSEHK